MRIRSGSVVSTLPIATFVGGLLAASCSSPVSDEEPLASGTLQVVMNTSNEIGYLLQEDDGDYIRLDMEGAVAVDDDEPDWRTAGGSPVDVFGQPADDGSIVVESLRISARTHGRIGRNTSALLTKGTRRVLVLRVQFDGGATMGSASEVTTLLKNTASYFTDASFNQLSLTYDVAGPYNITFGSCNDYGRWMGDAKTAAQNAGYNLSSYQHYMVIGPINCGYGGLGAQPGSDTWIAGLWTDVVAHELGHNLGLFHASSRACTNASGAAVPMSDTCTFAEYGDPFDTMGSGGKHHVNAVYKSNLGWLPPSQVRTAVGDQSYTLAPMTTANPGLQLIRVRGANGMQYSLEVRQSSSVDSYASGSAVTKGVLVHAFYPGVWDSARSVLLDMVPGGDFNDAALPSGSSYTFPGTTTTLKVNSVSTSGAQIQITGAGASPVGERLRILSSGKCLSLEGGVQDAGTRVLQRPCDGGADQDWLFVDNGDGYFVIKTAVGGRCLDLASGSSAEGAAINMWDCNNGNNQKWALVANGSGHALRSRASGKCASLGAGSTADGAQLVQATCSAATDQQFKRGGGEKLVNQHSGKCLGIENESTAGAAAVVQYTCNEATSQQWAFENMGNGAYALRNVASGMCLDVLNWSQADGASLIQWPCTGGANQLWQPSASGAGVALRSVLSGKCVDDYNLSVAEGWKMVQWTCNGGAWQSFARK